MKNQSGSSRMDAVLKMLLIAFISLLAFSSGVYFGKQLSDSDYQLKALEGDFNPGGAHAKAGDHEGDEAISEEEVAAISEKLVNAEKAEMNKDSKTEEGDGHGVAKADGHSEASGKDGDGHEKDSRDVASAKEAHTDADKNAKSDHGDKAATLSAKETKAAHGEADATHAKNDAKPDLSVAAKAAERVANNHAPTEPPKPKEPSRVPTSLPKTVGTSHDVEFTVQVASYPTQEAAKGYADDLVAKGFPAFPVVANVGGKTWYRVSVGSFKTQKDADTYRAQLLKQANLTSAIVQRIQR